ncbi:MAG: ATP-binding protein [Bacillota bacterium]
MPGSGFLPDPGLATGKTHLAIALGLKACMARKRVLFTTVQALLDQSSSRRLLREDRGPFPVLEGYVVSSEAPARGFAAAAEIDFRHQRSPSRKL